MKQNFQETLDKKKMADNYVASHYHLSEFNNQSLPRTEFYIVI
jgi:hypothetical protein